MVDPGDPFRVAISPFLGKWSLAMHSRDPLPRDSGMIKIRCLGALNTFETLCEEAGKALSRLFLVTEAIKLVSDTPRVPILPALVRPLVRVFRGTSLHLELILL